MFTHRSDGEGRDAFDYTNTIAHEMGHIFGLDDGYADDDFVNDNTLRPWADMLEGDDLMLNNHSERARVSAIDIQMLLIAAELGEWQYYMDYLDNVQSLGVIVYETCDD